MYISCGAKFSNVHKLCTLPGSGSRFRFLYRCIVVSLYRFLVVAVQKRVLSIIYPLTGYADCLQKSGIKPLSDRRVDACEKLFNEITTTPAANNKYA